VPLPDIASEKVVDAESIAVLMASATRLLERDDNDLEVLREAVCFRPMTETGVPLVARIEDAKLGVRTVDGGGVWIASGHGVWGISLSLGTGLCVSEMVEGREPSADISGLALNI
jgi:glycine/D-amino acid oxidase-like deaminating enzyme